MATGEAQADLIAALEDAAADLQEGEPERIQLPPGHPRRRQPAAQRVKQPVGGGVEQEPELVGEEAVAAEAIGLAGVLAFLEAALNPPSTIPVKRHA